MFTFPVSGVETYWWLPGIVAFFVSFFTSTCGISGAFILLPFQVSILGFNTPAVSPTNMLYNIVAIPGGVYRFIRERRMLWPLALSIMVGTAPGLVIGAYLRVTYLLEPRNFKLFVGLVLIYILIRLLRDITSKKSNSKQDMGNNSDFTVRSKIFTAKTIAFEFSGIHYSISTLWVFTLTVIVGIIGGAYGIGGGAIIAPFLVAFFGLPVYVVAGPALFGTFFTSIAGVFVYSLLLPHLAGGQMPVNPDWLLGLSMGIGGFLGIYSGARLQKYLPAKVIKIILAISIAIVVTEYIIDFFT